MAELVQIASATIKALHGAPGQAVVITGSGVGGQAVEAEVYAPAGFLSRPPKDARGVFIPIGGSRKYGVVIAGHNYKVSISLADGETAIFSTNAAGDTLKAQIVLKADGTIEINGNSKRFVTWDELNTALQNHTHSAGALVTTCPAGAGTVSGGATGAPVALDLSAAKTTTLKTGG
jgi:phage gp45-like